MDPRRAPARGVLRRPPGWLLAVAGVLIFCWAFDWAWFRPLIQRHVADHAHRRIDFDELRIGLNRDLQPRVLFRGLTITNADWAAPAPLVQAGELQFVLAWRSFIDKRTIVSRLILRDANVDLERQADGHRNWRLGNPDDTGPGRVRVLSVEAERTTLRFAHRGIALDLTSRIDASPSSAAGTPVLPPLTKLLTFTGTREGRNFEGRTQVSDTLTFFDTGRPFALRGEASAGSTRLQVDGTVTDIAELASIDAQVQLAGTQAADLAVAWPAAASFATPRPLAFEAVGRLKSDGLKTFVDDVMLKLGSSTLRGPMSYSRAGSDRQRPKLQADLRGEAVDLAEWRQATPSRHDAPTAAQAGTGTSRPIDLQPLQRTDADLRLTVERIVLPTLGGATRLQLHALLADGQLDIDPLQLDLAGGHLAGDLHLRADPTVPTLAGRVTLRDLKLEQLFASLPDSQHVTGRLGGQIDIRTQGRSLAAWLAGAGGTATLALHDATIADRLEARLQLSGGALLRTLVSGHEQVPLRCAAMTLALRNGVVSATRLSGATERVTLAGRGSFDLKSDALKVLLTPHREQSALLALDRSVQIEGRPGDVHVALVDRVNMPADPACRATAQPLSVAR